MDKYYCTSNFMVSILFMIILGLKLQNSEAFETFGFDIHHRYSEPVKGILNLHELPQKGSIEYYSAWTQRDRFIKGRRLADTGDPTPVPVTFAGGNKTVQLSSLGFLHYANVTVGTPGQSFLVALDTGSDLFWLPCNCNSCAHTFVTGSGKPIDLNIYKPNTSSTSNIVSCNTYSVAHSACGYTVAYLSNNTSSSGILVEDILRLQTDSTEEKTVEAPITLGCGMKQTGAFLNGAAPNGLFGLGMDSISVPSILASRGLAANSFSMCFSTDGIGSIDFGDKGSPGQGETPFNLEQPHQTYNISLTGITVGKRESYVDFTAIFDTGTSFTYLNDPAYRVVTENFNSQAQEQRIQPTVQVPFEYCYQLNSKQTSFKSPDVSLKMKGGNQFYLFAPIITFSLQDGSRAYCLAVAKSGDINIIGQNFMTGYRVVFDREKMVLGWKPSNCYNSKESNSATTLPIDKQKATGASSPTSVVPEATTGNKNGTTRLTPAFPSTTPTGNHATHFNSFFCQSVMALFSIFSYYLMIISS